MPFQPGHGRRVRAAFRYDVAVVRVLIAPPDMKSPRYRPNPGHGMLLGHECIVAGNNPARVLVPDQLPPSGVWQMSRDPGAKHGRPETGPLSAKAGLRTYGGAF